MRRLWLIILGIVVVVLGVLAGAYAWWKGRLDPRMEVLYGPPPIDEEQSVAPEVSDPADAGDSTQPEVSNDTTTDTGNSTK